MAITHGVDILKSHKIVSEVYELHLKISFWSGI